MPSIRIAVEVREEDRVVREISLEFVAVIVGEKTLQQPICRVRDIKTGTEAMVKLPYGEYTKLATLISTFNPENMEKLTRAVSLALNLVR